MQNERTRTRKNQRGEIALHGQEGERDKRDNLLNTKSQKNNTILKNIIKYHHISAREPARVEIALHGQEVKETRETQFKKSLKHTNNFNYHRIYPYYSHSQ